MSTQAPTRRRIDYHTWDELFADVDHLHDAGYRRAGNWDLSQMLEHIGVGLKTATHGIDHQGPWIVRKFIGPILLRRMMKTRRMGTGIKVPKWWLPGPGTDESAAIDQFRADYDAFQAMSGPAHPHPFLGRLDKPTWADFLLIHAAHHLSFLSPNDTAA